MVQNDLPDITGQLIQKTIAQNYPQKDGLSTVVGNSLVEDIKRKS
jgi:hypothetical protein